MDGRRDRTKVMAAIGIGGLILAVVITLSPLLLGGASGLLLFYSLPFGALIGLPALVLTISVAVIGVSRSWRTSLVRRVLAIISLASMLLSLIYIVALVNAWDDPSLGLLPVIGFVGFVMFIVTGFTGLGKRA